MNKALIRREAHSLSMRDMKQQGQLMHYKLAEDFVNSFDKEKWKVCRVLKEDAGNWRDFMYNAEVMRNLEN